MNQKQRSLRVQAEQAFANSLDQLGETFDIDEDDGGLMDRPVWPHSPIDTITSPSTIPTAPEPSHTQPRQTVGKRQTSIF